MNSSYCDCKVVNHTKISNVYSHGIFNSFKFYFSTLYAYFIQQLHTITKTNIAYTQNYTAKCKKRFTILKKVCNFQHNFLIHMPKVTLTQISNILQNCLPIKTFCVSVSNAPAGTIRLSQQNKQ